ncbi:short-chain dehydrogenase [Mesorhizobium sp. L103C565B0]|nr:short-chain dehydrogenase [Mesorhizobium sp. L103C565B0]
MSPFTCRFRFSCCGPHPDSFAMGAFAVSQPDEVDMNQILFRPTAREC